MQNEYWLFSSKFQLILCKQLLLSSIEKVVQIVTETKIKLFSTLNHELIELVTLTFFWLTLTIGSTAYEREKKYIVLEKNNLSNLPFREETNSQNPLYKILNWKALHVNVAGSFHFSYYRLTHVHIPWLYLKRHVLVTCTTIGTSISISRKAYAIISTTNHVSYHVSLFLLPERIEKHLRDL